MKDLTSYFEETATDLGFEASVEKITPNPKEIIYEVELSLEDRFQDMWVGGYFPQEETAEMDIESMKADYEEFLKQL